jgi:protein-tyrosine phosphatase
MYKVLFVCTGNICRSPTAEGVLRHRAEAQGLADRILVDSAGTHAYHVGEAPDQRSVKAAKKRGILIDGLRARKVAPGDFHEFDLILGLDFEHVQHLRRMAPKDAKAETALFLEYAGNLREKEVPDPYYGDEHHFEYALDLIEAGVEPLIEKLEQHIR